MTGRKRRWLRRAFVSLVLFLAVCIAVFFALPRLLIAPMNAARSDVILHVAIDPHSKADDYVAHLYRQGMAGKIVCISSQVSWEVYPADYVREHVISLGAPAENVTTLHLPLVPCAGVAVPMIAEFVKARGWKSALLICQPEDSRYAGWMAGRIFEQAGIDLSVSYAPEDKEELMQAWWRTHWKVQRFVGKAMNIALDLFYSECR